MSDRPTAVITGASSGIGAATARSFVAAGFSVVLAARRKDRLDELVGELGEDVARGIVCDVTKSEDVDALAEAVESCEVVLANAGGAQGQAPVAEFDEDHWRTMYETNVLGTARTVRAFAGKLAESGNGRIVILTSVAGHQTYPGGAGYTGAKHAEAVIADTLRVELLGQPVRVIEVAPGQVLTEFSLVRFGGDQAKADAVYAGLDPLRAEDVAEAITWAVTRPPHLTVARLDLMPVSQATARDYDRKSG